MVMSAGEIEYVREGVELGLREDGRHCHEYRPVRAEMGNIPQATGSARIQIGGTDVVVGVKVELGIPDPFHPDCGKIEFSVDFSPCGSPDFEGAEGEQKGGGIAQALARAWKLGPDGKACGVDLNPLGIISGKTCLVIYVDSMVLNTGGNVLDAISFGARVALFNMPIPHVEVSYEEGSNIPEIEVDDDPERCLTLDASSSPVFITVGQIGKQFVVDMSAMEEICAPVTLNVAVNSKGNVCGISKNGLEPMHPTIVQEMTETAQRLGNKVINSLDEFLLNRMETAN
ncbi:hypothetical protein BSKO_05135 [Bryopsis sp. KO-2023]|nr:hypothetical protein BSKO_05135 [Bryopsis sp. KO-2023]